MSASVTNVVTGILVASFAAWLNHYFAIRRELLFRSLSTDRTTTIALSRQSLLKDWQRALLAIVLSALVNVATFALCMEWYISSLFSGFGGGQTSVNVSSIPTDLLAIGPWFYASCIIILFPLLVFIYRRVPEQHRRLILSLLMWSIHSGLFFAISASMSLNGFTPEDSKVLIYPWIGGAVGGLVYWIITYRKNPEQNAVTTH